MLLPDGRSLSLTRDGAGRPDALTVAEGTYDHDYYGTAVCTGCAPGKLWRITSPSGTTLSFSYDGALLTGSTWAGPVVAGSVSRTYDTDFRPNAETVTVGGSNATIRFGYDADSLLTCASPTSCAPAGGDALTIAYDPQVARATSVTLRATSEGRTYNAYGELASLSGLHGTTTLYSEIMDSTGAPRDKLGRVVTRSESLPSGSSSWEYHYDAQGRLFEVLRDGASYEFITYDGNGNRLTHVTDTTSVTTDYDAQDRLLRYGDFAYTYTASGQLQTKTHTPTGAVTSYSYDVRGNLLRVVLPNADVIEYVVDGLNRRVAKKKNGVVQRRWLYGDQLRIVAELDGAGNLLSRLVYASRANVPDYIIRGGTTYRVFADHLGSPRVIVNSVTPATVAQEMEHDAFGNVLTDTNPGFTPFGFAGGLWDADTGLVRYGARDYDPVTGRWTAKDPVLFDGGDGNLYAYVGNDPVNYADPEGTILHVVGGAVGGGLAGAIGGGVAGFLKGYSQTGNFDYALHTAGSGAAFGAVVGAATGVFATTGILTPFQASALGLAGRGALFSQGFWYGALGAKLPGFFGTLGGSLLENLKNPSPAQGQPCP